MMKDVDYENHIKYGKFVMNVLQINQERNSSIELLKIIAIFLIIINHVVQSASEASPFLANQEYLINLSTATTDVSRLFLSSLRSVGAFANNLFFICSAYFFLDNKEVKINKISNLVLDVWFISIFFLIVCFIGRNGQIDLQLAIKQIFPITFGNNWYISCYLIFYMLYRYLNKIIDNCTQNELFHFVFVSSLLYIFGNFIFGNCFFRSILIDWIVIYFLLAYIKKYHSQIIKCRKFNIIVLFIGILGHISVFLIMNFLGLKFSCFYDKILHFNKICSPFLIAIAISVFFLFSNKNYKSNLVNYVASLSLYIYLVHENMLLRLLYRPYLWKWAFENFGYNSYLYLSIIFSVGVFILSVLCSIFLQFTLLRVSRCISKVIINLKK